MSVGEDGATDPFPVGMRVLAVDDDPICLKVLENLLRKCLYQVATANQAAVALKMLREDPDKYDLVISDVNMPGINGFKLLELVGLEMDLPVIMLSAHSDTETVMKGITHGACDYLLKPVRIEELKNIWQHVVRKKKFEPNKVPNQDKDHAQAGCGQGVTSSGNGDQSEKSNRKRKEHSDDDEEEDGDEDGPENDSTQKKPRVVWCVDLHRKFVAAVNQLGLDKAVPKKILDLMNVERLSRENVASHLQKYRLYLKRISQQANMVTLGGRNSSYAHMCSLDGYGDFQALTGSARFSNTSLSSYPPGGVLGRLNSPAGLSNSQNLTNSLNSLGTCHSSILPSNRSASLFQGIPTSLDFNQLQQRKMAPPLTGFNPTNDPTAFVGTSYQETSSSIGCPSNSFVNSSANPLILQGNPQQGLYRAGFSNQSSLRAGPSHPSSIEMGPSCSSTFLDENRSNDCWQSGVQLANFPSNSLPLSEPFSHAGNNMIDGISSTSSHILTNPTEMASIGAVQCQRSLIGNAVQNTDFGSNQMCGMGYNYGMNNTFGAMDSLLSSNGVMGMDQGNSVSGKSINASLISQPVTPAAIQHSELDNSAMGTRMRSNEYLMEQTKAQDGFIHESLNDLLNVMNKRNNTGQHYQEENINKMHPHLDGSCI